MSGVNYIEQALIEKGFSVTEQRRIIAKILSESNDHPSLEQIYARAKEINPKFGLATVYRTVSLFEELEIIERLEFKNGETRYEEKDKAKHHDHIINIETGEVVEFFSQELEDLKMAVVKKMGFELMDHKLDLYCKPIK